MILVFLGLSFLQAIVILADELFFHRQRHLPRWERTGHPIDTLFLLCCFLFLIFFRPSPLNEKIYLGLALVSCLVITKDEWVHQKLSPPAEMWLHALLFILHPLVLLTAYLIWGGPLLILELTASAIGIFMLYQIIYWNFYAKN